MDKETTKAEELDSFSEYRLIELCEIVSKELRKHHSNNIEVRISQRGYEVMFSDKFINPKTGNKFICY